MLQPDPIVVKRRPLARPRPWILATIITVLLIALVAVVAQLQTQQPATPVPTAEPAPAPPALNARARIAPVRQARIGTLSGGVIATLSVQVGQTVEEQQEVARVRQATGTEVLTAPWSGTITGIPVSVGDTVLPGTTIAYLSDLSRLQVETTDVDEFIIASIHAGQAVTLTVDALEEREYSGVVRTVGLQQQPNDTGDAHYPVTIQINGPTADLRPGMSARVYFER